MHDLAAMADQLRASGEYRIQRRLLVRLRLHDPNSAPTRSGLFVDVETTGLNPQKHEIIELAIIPFSYLPSGLICDIGPPLGHLNPTDRYIDGNYGHQEAEITFPRQEIYFRDVELLTAFNRFSDRI